VSQSIVREPLLTAMLDGARVARVESARIELAPGQRTGLHFHPCPVVGSVVAGTIRLAVEGEPERTLRQGDAFYEPADTRIAAFDNESEQEPATFVAFYLLPEGEDRLIVMVE